MAKTESRVSTEEYAPRKLTLRRLADLSDSLPASEDDPEVQVVELQPDEVLFRQGDEADSMYGLLAGVLDVRLAHDDGKEW